MHVLVFFIKINIDKKNNLDNLGFIILIIN